MPGAGLSTSPTSVTAALPVVNPSIATGNDWRPTVKVVRGQKTRAPFELSFFLILSV